MNVNGLAVFEYYHKLYKKLLDEDFVIDKSGVKTVEIIAPRIVFPDPYEEMIEFTSTIKSPAKYVDQETKWYNSHSLDIEMVNDVEIWQRVSDENNEINSNYGNLVYSRNNFSQFSHAKNALIKNPNTRQAIILYTRPSIHLEHNSLGVEDFICTMYQQFFIRKNKLECITSMRSNDARFGLLNDLPWYHKVIKNMYWKLLQSYPDLELGEHIFIPNSFHIYERHFEWLKNLILTLSNSEK